ncbi:uncharacterized protein LOC112873152 [Panicum hallii]|uniref:uncharacterized protein LOC112873152 n=1 Tax=Panicum hallii TaxID=206008 RepID=UPI000DF4CF11|nr:uncharacterized protein LOC112873152 [Panicum hallii]
MAAEAVSRRLAAAVRELSGAWYGRHMAAAERAIRARLPLLLSVVRLRIGEIKHGESDCTGTVLLVGIPNVGKSTIVNAMHQIGRIGWWEMAELTYILVAHGKLVKHMKVPKRRAINFSISTTSAYIHVDTVWLDGLFVHFGDDYFSLFLVDTV